MTSPCRAEGATRPSTALGEVDTAKPWRVGASPNGATHSWLMTYDVRGRLESVTLDGTTSVYGYDPNGNMTTVDGSTFGTYDAQDRLVTLSPTSGSGPWTYSYTNNGDLQSKADSAQEYSFDYDLSSNLRGVQVNTSISAGITYLIDGSNRRIGKAITPSLGSSVADGLLYDELGRVVAELDGSGNVLSTFVYGLKPNVPDYMVRGGTAYRIISDWRGDVRLVVNTTETGSAAVVQQVDYDAWGNVTKIVDPDCSVGGAALCFQPFGFAGGLFDVTTGIVKFGARDYDPVARRWTQKDPLSLAAGTNVYIYVGDDPINGSDPSGKISGACLDQIEQNCQAACEASAALRCAPGLLVGPCTELCVEVQTSIENANPGFLCEDTAQLSWLPGPSARLSRPQAARR